MTHKEKYHRAVICLQAIAQRTGYYKGGGVDEWSQAEAFLDCRRAAKICLEIIGEEDHLTYDD